MLETVDSSSELSRLASECSYHYLGGSCIDVHVDIHILLQESHNVHSYPYLERFELHLIHLKSFVCLYSWMMMLSCHCCSCSFSKFHLPFQICIALWLEGFHQRFQLFFKMYHDCLNHHHYLQNNRALNNNHLLDTQSFHLNH